MTMLKLITPEPDDEWRRAARRRERIGVLSVIFILGAIVVAIWFGGR